MKTNISQKRPVVISQPHFRYCVDFCRKGGFDAKDTRFYSTFLELVEALPDLLQTVKTEGKYESLQVSGLDKASMRDVLASIEVIGKKRVDMRFSERFITVLNR